MYNHLKRLGGVPMFENLEVEKILEDQFHERHKFKVNIQGDDYSGILS